jgi:hypothetical protein
MRNCSDERVKKLYRLVYQREPTARQLKRSLEFVGTEKSEAPPEEKAETSIWGYGYGEIDETAGRVKRFEPLPHFTGEAWQGGKSWPDEKLGWAQLTAAGGHAGNDAQHVVIRRWVAPVDGTVAIEGSIKHEHAEGDGVRAFMASSRKGLLGKWVLHNQAADGKVESLEVKAGDTVDFVVSIHQSLNNNDFVWSPTIRLIGPAAVPTGKRAKNWSATKDFAGPPGEPQKPLDAWEQYAQVLLLSNEFVFVD